jgi:type II secretory pathway component PulF
MPVTLEDIQNLSYEVSSLVKAGLPLESHLANAGAGHNKQLKQLTESISLRLQNGESLEDVVRDNKIGAPRMLAAAVAAGIQTGRLSETVELLGDVANDLVDLRRRILQSLSYPLTVVATAILLFLVFIRAFLARVHYLINDHDIHVSPIFRSALEYDAAFWWWPIVFPLIGGVFMLLWVGSGRAQSMAFRGPERILFLLPGVASMIRDLKF